MTISMTSNVRECRVNTGPNLRVLWREAAITHGSWPSTPDNLLTALTQLHHYRTRMQEDYPRSHYFGTLVTLDGQELPDIHGQTLTLYRQQYLTPPGSLSPDRQCYWLLRRLVELQQAVPE